MGINEAHYGRDHFQTANTLMNLGNAYGDLGNVQKKRELLERALGIFDAHYGRDHYQTAITLENLGNAYGALGNVQKKRELLERALGIQEAHYGRDHYQTANTLMNLGNAYGALGNVQKQRELLERALGINEAHYGRDHPELSLTLTNLAVTYQTLEQPVVALQTAQRAYRILMTHPDYGAEHPRTQQCIAYLQSVGEFTLQALQGREASVAESKQPAKRSSAAAPLSLPIAQHLSQQGLASSGVQQAQHTLGRAVLRLMAAINTQRTAQWEAQAHCNYTATIVSALAKGGENFAQLCAAPEMHSIPARLATFIQDYVRNHPELRELGAQPEFASSLKKAFISGNIDALYTRFDLPKPDEKERKAVVTANTNPRLSQMM